MVHTIAYSKSHRDNGVIQARGKIDDEANTLSCGDGCTNQSTGNYVFYTEEEEWRDVVGYEGYYQVSSLGRVKSLDRGYTSPTGGIGIRKGRMLTLKPHKITGYVQVDLNKEGVTEKSVKVHRLVAQAFIPNPENKPQVNHINSNKSDNRAVNLEWSTHSENMQHAYDFGNKEGSKGEENGNSKLTNQQVLEICELLDSGQMLQREIADKYGVCRMTVNHINLGIKYQSITGRGTGDGCTNQSTGNYVFTKESGVNPKVIGSADINRGDDNWNGPRDGYQIYDKEFVSPALRVTQPGNVRIVETKEEDMAVQDCVVVHYGHVNKPHEIKKLSPTLKAQSHGHEPMAVDVEGSTIRIRKLTPVETERLQGYPDNHTKFGRRPDGSIYEMSNSQRYKMCGNGISSPVPAFLFPSIFGTDEYEILDLFSGCHGTGLLLPSNFKTVAFAEIDKYASDVLRYHNPDIPNLGSVTEIVNRTDVPNFNMLVGGFPCQSWSIAGLRKGFSDERGQLIYNVFDILRKFRPKALVLENVKGLLSKDNGDAFEAIMEFLSELGYELDFEVVNSKHFGLAQNRERVFIFGRLK